MGCLNSSLQSDTKSDNVEYIYSRNVLLLGTETSGKSTIYKSIQCMNDDVDEYERSMIKSFIRYNCVAGIILLLRATQTLYDSDPQTYKACLVPLESDKDQNVVDIQFLVLYGDEYFTEEQELDFKECQKLAQCIERLWNLEGVQVTFKWRLKQTYYAPDNIDYFLNKVNEIMKEEYIPSQDDILKVRIRTFGLFNEYEWKIKETQTKIKMIEYGRKNNSLSQSVHLHQILPISHVFFVVGLNAYCSTIYDDGYDHNKNGLVESLELFEETIVNNKEFRKYKICLLFNKVDLFREALEITPLSFFCDIYDNPDYQYKGRIFADNMLKMNDVKIVSKLLSLMIDDINKLIIPMDVIQIITIYFDLDEEWLNLCVNDGIAFIKNLFLSSVNTLINNECFEIHVHVISAIIPNSIRNMLEKHGMLSDDMKLKENDDPIWIKTISNIYELYGSKCDNDIHKLDNLYDEAICLSINNDAI